MNHKKLTVCVIFSDISHHATRVEHGPVVVHVGRADVEDPVSFETAPWDLRDHVQLPHGVTLGEIPVHVRPRHVHLTVLVDAEAGVAVLVVHEVAAQAVRYRDVRIRSRRRDLQHARNCDQNRIDAAQCSSISFYFKLMRK